MSCDNTITKLQNRLFLMHEQGRLFTIISDIEDALNNKNTLLDQINITIAEVVELCRIEECYLTDYEMLLEQKCSVEEEIKNDMKYIEELVIKYNKCEDEIRECG
jgi:hypothetical protein